MKCAIHKKSRGVLLVALEGSPNIYELDQFKKALDDVLEKAARQRRLIVDFSGVQVMDELALGFFVSFSRSYRSQGGELKLIGLNHTLKNLFDYALLSKVYDIYSSLEEAKRTFDYAS